MVHSGNLSIFDLLYSLFMVAAHAKMQGKTVTASAWDYPQYFYSYRTQQFIFLLGISFNCSAYRIPRVYVAYSHIIADNAKSLFGIL